MFKKLPMLSIKKIQDFTHGKIKQIIFGTHVIYSFYNKYKQQHCNVWCNLTYLQIYF